MKNKFKIVDIPKNLSNNDNIESKDKHNYMMLDRLKQDCEYFINNKDKGVTSKSLWAGNVKDQIEKMKELFEKLEVKPEWLSMNDIERFENNML